MLSTVDWKGKIKLIICLIEVQIDLKLKMGITAGFSTGICGQKSKQVIKGKEKNSRYTVMEENLSLFVLTLQRHLRGLGNSMSKKIPQS